jgi:hypothetical protein
MKNKKLNLDDFKANQLVKKQLMSIAGGNETWVYDPRTNTLNYIYLIGPNGDSDDGDGDGKISNP